MHRRDLLKGAGAVLAAAATPVAATLVEAALEPAVAGDGGTVLLQDIIPWVPVNLSDPLFAKVAWATSSWRRGEGWRWLELRHPVTGDVVAYRMWPDTRPELPFETRESVERLMGYAEETD